MSFGYQVLGFGSGGIGFTYIVATGGDSIATDGDYKVHTFTSPGTFAVSATGGDTTPTTYRDKISYMVVKPVAAEPEVLEQMMQLLVEVFHRFLH